MITRTDNFKTKSSQDTVDLIIQETFEHYQSQGQNIWGHGFNEFLSEDSLYSDLIDHFATGMEADTAEAYSGMSDNLRMMNLQEQLLSNFSPIASLAPAILRKFFPKICVKDALPSEVTTVPTFKIGYLTPYVVDIDGTKKELPKAIRDRFAPDGGTPYGRQLSTLYTGWIPATHYVNMNVLNGLNDGSDALTGASNTYTPTSYDLHVKGKRNISLDPNFRLVGVKLSLNDSTTNTHTKVELNDLNILKDINGNLFGNFSKKITLSATGTAEANGVVAASSYIRTAEAGPVYTSNTLLADTVTVTGTVFGHIELGTGRLIVAMSNLNAVYTLSTATNPNAAVTPNSGVWTAANRFPTGHSIKIKGFVSPEMHNYAESVTFELRNKEVTIGAGSHISSPVPIEFLQDTMATFKIDGTLKIIDIMSTVLAQGVDAEAFQFLANSFIINNLDKVDLLGNTGKGGYLRGFNVIPPKEFNYRPREWREELKDIIDFLAIKLRSDLSYPGGKFQLIMNPLEARLITNINWVYTAGKAEKDGVQIDFSVGNFTGANYYELVSTENIPQGRIMMFFYPSQEDQMTYKYFPYTFNIESNGTYRDPNNPNVPAIMMTKRHTFEEFTPLQAQISIHNNDGNMGTNGFYWGEAAVDSNTQDDGYTA
jgi:hypothetical protein